MTVSLDYKIAHSFKGDERRKAESKGETFLKPNIKINIDILSKFETKKVKSYL